MAGNANGREFRNDKDGRRASVHGEEVVVGEDSVPPQKIAGEAKPSSRSGTCKRQWMDPAATGWGEGRHTTTKRLKQARFLSFHQGILGLLHQDDKCLDPKIWETIQRFLQQRERLLESKHRAGSMKDIHNESLRHCDGEAAWMAQSQLACTNSHNDKANSANSTTATPSMQNLAFYFNSNTSVKPSAVLSRPTIRGSFLQSQQQSLSQTSPATCRSGGGTTDHHHNSNSTNPHSDNQFYIVARLLGRQHHIMESNFQQQAQPFQPLLASTIARIGVLQQELHHCRQRRWVTDHQRVSEALAVDDERWNNNSHSGDTTFTTATSCTAVDEENERSRVVTLESKIRLWSLLAQDLQDAILSGPDSAAASKVD